MARSKADRLFDGILSAQARNLFGHMALLNALDLRLRAAEIVVTGAGDDLVKAALKLPFLDRVVLRAPSADALPPNHPAQEKLKAVHRAGRLRLRGRDLLAAGERRRRARAGGRGHAGALICRRQS